METTTHERFRQDDFGFYGKAGAARSKATGCNIRVVLSAGSRESARVIIQDSVVDSNPYRQHLSFYDPYSVNFVIIE